MPLYYTVADLASGDILPETWVDQVKANLDGLIVKPACHVYAGTNINLGNGSSTALVFTSERFDTDSMHDTSSNTTRITFQTAGIYSVGGQVLFNADADGHRTLSVRLNGSTVIGQQRLPASSASDGLGMNVQTLWSMGSGDYVELVGLQNAGNDLAVLANGSWSPSFWAHWIGRTTAP